MLLHDRKGGGAARAGGWFAVDRSRRVEVVAHHERGTDAVANLHERGERHGPPVGPRHLEVLERPADVAAVDGIRLHVDLP